MSSLRLPLFFDLSTRFEFFLLDESLDSKESDELSEPLELSSEDDELELLEGFLRFFVLDTTDFFGVSSEVFGGLFGGDGDREGRRLRGLGDRKGLARGFGEGLGDRRRLGRRLGGLVEREGLRRRR